MDTVRELSFEELSALFSNLGNTCTKQFRTEEAELFNRLSDYYKSRSIPVEEKQLKDLNPLIQKDLKFNYPAANRIAEEEKDRGALRALAWGEKITRIHNSLLNRYEKQKDALLQNTNIYVCEICGFIYIGDEAPEICPVCKVPNFKMSKVQKEVM